MHNTLHRFQIYQTGALQTNMQRVAMTESPFPVTQIESLVRDTRRARLADEDLTEDDVADMRNSQLLGEPPLIGDCAANAVALCKTLDDEYFNPILVWGALHYDDDETPPATIQEAQSRGATHFWVELEHENNRLILEIASEDPDTFGKPHIASGLPDVYHRLPGGRFHYSSNAGISPDVLRGDQGYSLLNQRLTQA